MSKFSEPVVFGYLLHGFLLRATLSPSESSTFIEGGCGTLSRRFRSLKTILRT